MTTGRVLTFDDGLDAPEEFCCASIQYQMTGTCRGADIHTTNTEQCPKQVITYSSRFREYHISPVNLYTYLISFCPFCGKEFPSSLRSKWFDDLKALGHDDPLTDDSIPEEYHSDAWWKNV
jgi:hypothetical protein